MKATCVIFIALLFTLKASACDNIRLDKYQEGMKYAKLPVKNMKMTDQKKLGICYAHTANQMIDAKINLDNINKGIHNKVSNTSPLFTAISLERDQWKKDYSASDSFQFEGGLLNYTLLELREIGTCDKRSVDELFNVLQDNFSYSSVLKGMRNFDIKLRDRIEKIDRIDGAIYNQVRSDIYFQAPGSDSIYQNSRSIRDRQDREAWSSFVGKKTVIQQKFEEKLYRYLNSKLGIKLPEKDIFFKNFSVNSLESPKYLSYLLGLACKDSSKKQVPSFDLTTLTRSETKEMTKDISQRLLESNLPVGISYCANFLFKGKRYKKFSHKGSTNTMALEKCSGHASIVIGSRKNRKTNKCELLIRNSWGETCSPYSKDWECEKGQIWVDEETIDYNLKYYSFFN